VNDTLGSPLNESGGAAVQNAPKDGSASAGLERYARSLQPRGYITTGLLAALWDERARQAEARRLAAPDDLQGLEQRQRLATNALQAYRFLAELEQHLGFEVALPILGPLPVTSGE
jgi:hypothetical protein